LSQFPKKKKTLKRNIIKSNILTMDNFMYVQIYIKPNIVFVTGRSDVN